MKETKLPGAEINVSASGSGVAMVWNLGGGGNRGARFLNGGGGKPVINK